jgi:predicted TIM-barrel fold metal-dependent hydrolase
MTTSEIPKIISVDDHVVEPPDVWTSRLPKKYVDVGPRVKYEPRGEMRLVDGSWVETPGDGPDMAAWWYFEDKRSQMKLPTACPGIPYDQIDPIGVTFEDIRTACYDPQARLADMDMNHIEASLCFPNYPRFCGQLLSEGKDKELGLLCVQAYNDWMVEEWCADSDGRLVPLCVVPLWDAELAAAEVRRNAARGVHAVAWTELPTWLGLPSIYSGFWDPFFQACDETGSVICMHIGSGSRTVRPSADSPDVVNTTVIGLNSQISMADMLFSDNLIRFPGLKLLYAESQIGWIPFFLERADDNWVTHRWAQDDRRIPEPPSHYYADHIYSCFFKDSVGIELIERVGVDNVLFETDYPHADGTWPHSKETAAGLFGHLPQDQVNKLARNNAIDLLGLGFERA